MARHNLTEFKAYLKRTGRMEKTVRDYAYKVEAFLDYLEGRPLTLEECIDLALQTYQRRRHD